MCSKVVNAGVGPVILTTFGSAACYAYNLEDCERLGRTAKECADEDPWYRLVLIVELQKDYLLLSLRIALADNEERVFPEEGQAVNLELGEASGRLLEEVCWTYVTAQGCDLRPSLEDWP